MLEFDELHAVSDLHLGGLPGFQIFDQGKQLAALVDHLAASEAREVGLVLNGDVVDFLAEAPSAYLDAAGAEAKLQRIFADPAFAPVWDAFARFVSTKRRTLVIVLGNHDVELALPHARELVRRRLCGNSAGARGRLVFATDGAGFACSVGGQGVLCLHGNEVDPFNVVDYRQLLDVTRAINRSTSPLPEWTPNAGTKLVIDIMNPVKRRLPFVDLLKPETSAVPAVILAADPGQLKRLKGFFPVAARLATDAVRMATGFLSADGEAIEERGVEDDALERMLRPLSAARGGEPLDVLLERVEGHVDRGVEPLDVGVGEGAEMLGVGGLVLDAFLKRDPEENLREALSSWLGDDDTFDIGKRDDTFVKLDEAVGGEVDFLLAGHTHLHRALRRGSGGAYFNSGTWIRLIRLRPEMLAGDGFGPVFDAIKRGTMEALDSVDGLVLRRPTVVSIVADGGSAFGEVRTVALGGGGVSLEPVANGRLEARGR